jgi:hypothetical protein
MSLRGALVTLDTRNVAAWFQLALLTKCLVRSRTCLSPSELCGARPNLSFAI